MLKFFSSNNYGISKKSGDNMRIHLYNPNRSAGKTNATFINGIRQ